MAKALRDTAQKTLLALGGFRSTNCHRRRRRRQRVERVSSERLSRGVRLEVKERWRSFLVRVCRQREEESSQRGRREGRHVAVRVAVAAAPKRSISISEWNQGFRFPLPTLTFW